MTNIDVYHIVIFIFSSLGFLHFRPIQLHSLLRGPESVQDQTKTWTHNQRPYSATINHPTTNIYNLKSQHNLFNLKSRHNPFNIFQYNLYDPFQNSESKSVEVRGLARSLEMLIPANCSHKPTPSNQQDLIQIVRSFHFRQKFLTTCSSPSPNSSASPGIQEVNEAMAARPPQDGIHHNLCKVKPHETAQILSQWRHS